MQIHAHVSNSVWEELKTLCREWPTPPSETAICRFAMEELARHPIPPCEITLPVGAKHIRTCSISGDKEQDARWQELKATHGSCKNALRVALQEMLRVARDEAGYQRACAVFDPQ
jgi:hypothetical protein